MTPLLRAHLTTGVALVAAGAVAVAPSLAPPPVGNPITSPSIELIAAVVPLPTLADEIQRGIVPSLGQPVPTPNAPTATPAATNVNQAIKNVYNAAEPWVRYGFELATYAAGWVPYVGWLSPQIMIFYNFGERIVRSITFNLDDWIFGPLPFGQGLANVARDSWNALVQLGIDEWNFWLPPLPPLPPLPFTAQTTAPAASVPTAQQLPARTPADLRSLGTQRTPRARSSESVDDTPAVAQDSQADPASPHGTVTRTARDPSRTIPGKTSTDTGSAGIPRRVADDTHSVRRTSSPDAKPAPKHGSARHAAETGTERHQQTGKRGPSV